MKAIKRHSLGALTTSTCNTPEFSQSLADFFGLGLSFGKMVLVQTPDIEMLIGWIRFGKAQTTILETCADYNLLGDTADERHDAESSHDAWSK